jgi:hypothetical protein
MLVVVFGVARHFILEKPMQARRERITKAKTQRKKTLRLGVRFTMASEWN